ncbi:MAG: glycosyltransferase family 4 protein [Candidatus Brennerbacteria bacterium]|nr:glycosyltransferase family 4 protein [Candidatus Brennerbacteria bacterium]
MKILLDARLLFSGVHTGIEEYTLNLFSKLFEIDEKNRYQIFTNGWHTFKLPRAWRKIPSVNWGVPNRLLDVSFRLLSFPKVDRLARADLYFSPHFNLLKFTSRARRIITIHDLSFVRFPLFFPRGKRLWHAAQDVRHQVERACHLIAVSEATKQDLISLWNVPKENISMIHSGISPRYQALPSHDFILTRFRVEKNLTKPFMLYVGTIEPRKNVLGALEAFHLLKRKPAYRDFGFVVAGRLGWLYGDVVKAFRESPYRNTIRFWGPASKEDVLMLYNTAAVFVYPSFYEGFGFPPLEAQACGCPVVASTGGSLPEVLGASALLADPHRSDKLAEAIDVVLSRNGEAERLRIAGFANIARFSWETAARKTLACFESVRKQ